MTAIAAKPARPRQARRNVPRSAFRNLTVTEAKLLAREVVPLVWGIGFPVAMLSFVGHSSPGPDKSLGGISLATAYVPVLIAFSCAAFALQGLPTVLANYRERGILRRLNATPVGAARLLGAQLTVNLSVALIATLGILVTGVAFGVPLPGQPAGFVLALLLTAAAMIGLGLLVASVARNGRMAGALGMMTFLPLMFFAGLWLPQNAMSPRLRAIGQDTPLGAAVAALQHSMAGQWPSAAGLGVLAGYAVVFGLLAWRLFRWE